MGSSSAMKIAQRKIPPNLGASFLEKSLQGKLPLKNALFYKNFTLGNKMQLYFFLVFQMQVMAHHQMRLTRSYAIPKIFSYVSQNLSLLTSHIAFMFSCQWLQLRYARTVKCCTKIKCANTKSIFCFCIYLISYTLQPIHIYIG